MYIESMLKNGQKIQEKSLNDHIFLLSHSKCKFFRILERIFVYNTKKRTKKWNKKIIR
jgi:hypothetical protein